MSSHEDGLLHMKNKKKNQVAYHLVNTRYVVIRMNEEGKNRQSRNEIGSGWAFAQPEFAQTTLILVFLTFMTACFCSLNILCTVCNTQLITGTYAAYFWRDSFVIGNTEYHVA